MAPSTEPVPPEVIEVGGVSLAYRRAGSGDPLVYFHGGGLTRRWLPLYGRLAEHFDTVVPEHPGFGDSIRPRWFRTLDDLVLHEADALSALGLDSFHAVGHSIGGLVAGSLAAVYPERVRSLTLITPAPLPIASPEGSVRVNFAELPEGFDMDTVLFNENQAAYPEFLHGDDEGDRIAEDTDPFADPGAWDMWGAPGLYRRLARFAGPRQVLVPDDDRLFAPVCFETWARYLGDAPLVHIAGDRHPTGHLLIVQEPGRIVESVLALARTSGH
ncbi:MAG TPA: alpha/beta hydrolase [Solirubrobacteraceae bacterium]|nr:alpha/beta hydrolase [Solirubrobacteraceae bacterium]